MVTWPSLIVPRELRYQGSGTCLPQCLGIFNVYKPPLKTLPTASWRSPCPARASPSASSAFGYLGFLPAATHRNGRGRTSPGRGPRWVKPDHDAGAWAATCQAGEDAAPYSNIIRQMAQLVPPPCPHPGCATLPAAPTADTTSPRDVSLGGSKLPALGSLKEAGEGLLGGAKQSSQVQAPLAWPS